MMLERIHESRRVENAALLAASRNPNKIYYKYKEVANKNCYFYIPIFGKIK